MTGPATTPFDWCPRLAVERDIPALAELIPLSVRTLQAPHYLPEQLRVALEKEVYGVDRQLIRDRTYFVVEFAGQIVGCGGWSRRRSTYGGDLHRTEPDSELDPERDPARIRAFFVHPQWARRGIGRSIMTACEEAILAAGFRTVEIVATLTGEPLYAGFGYDVVERYEIPMTPGLGLPVVRMTKRMGRRAVPDSGGKFESRCAVDSKD
jgi:N-acetylglutamate synthase-like GNAT family acetyltransferase